MRGFVGVDVVVVDDGGRDEKSKGEVWMGDLLREVGEETGGGGDIARGGG